MTTTSTTVRIERHRRIRVRGVADHPFLEARRKARIGRSPFGQRSGLIIENIERCEQSPARLHRTRDLTQVIMVAIATAAPNFGGFGSHKGHNRVIG